MAEEITASNIQIGDDAFEYLKAQRGRIARLSGDRSRWTMAYHESLNADFQSMLPFLPPNADRILDVGSGLGGIDVLLSRYFKQPEIWLLDGDDDSPVMVYHRQTHNCMRTARRFLGMNGVANIVTVSPGLEIQAAPTDLIISLQSWCFHYNPESYLAYVKDFCRPGTVLILDVRRDYKTWHAVLEKAFCRVGVAHAGEKFERVVFHAP